METWIWTDKIRNETQLVYFKKTITLATSNITGSLSITADSRYKLYVNGILVEVGPNKGSFSEHFYDEIDLSKYLCQGKNILSIKVLHYSPEHLQGNFGIHRTKTPGLWINGYINDNRRKIILKSDDSWLTFENQNFNIVSEDDVFAPMQIYEDYQGTKIDKELFTDNVNDWEKACIYRDEDQDLILQKKNLKKRPIPFMYRRKNKFEKVVTVRDSPHSKVTWEDFLINPSKLVLPANSHHVVELSAGQEMTAYFNLALEKGMGATIKILQAECYVSTKRTQVNGLIIPVKGDRTDYVNGHLEGFSDTYHVAGYGDDVYPEIYQPYWFRTFRYIRLEIQVASQDLILNNFDYEETGYPLEVKTQVKTSDSSLDQILEISERTLRRCMHETYEDCPFYEQLEYVMDTRAQILYTYACSADDRLARNAIRNFRNSQQSDGTLNAAYPSYEKNIIPGFSIYFILIVYDHMMYFDDKDLLKENLSCIDKILSFYEKKQTEKGYVGVLGGLNGKARYWSFIDWTPQWNKTTGVPTAYRQGSLTMESLLYIYGLQAAAKIAKHLGESELTADYLKRAERTQESLLTYCLGSNGMLQDGPGVEEYSQHCQVFGILTKTLSYKQGREALLKTLKYKKTYTQCSVAMSFYLFQSLDQVDLYDYANSYWNIWRRMLKKNCTTSVEAEAGERSECHAWGALALYELPTNVLGVRPANPGYETIEICPHTENLDWARGKIFTPKGYVYIDWQKKDGKIKLNYQLPDSMKIK